MNHLESSATPDYIHLLIWSYFAANCAFFLDFLANHIILEFVAIDNDNWT